MMNSSIQTIIVSIIISSIVAFITAKLEYKKHIDTIVFERRQELYISFFEILLSLKQNPFNQFSPVTIQKLNSIQTEFRLFGEQKCIDSFLFIQKELNRINRDYQYKQEIEQEENDIRQMNDDLAYYEIQEEWNNYKMKHKIDDSMLLQQIDIACKKIRKSLRIS